MTKIYVNSWGYDQTNIDCYQVVGETKSGKTEIVRPIKTHTVPGSQGFMSDRVVPVPDSFVGTEFRIRKGSSFKYGGTEVWDGQRDYYRSWYA